MNAEPNPYDSPQEASRATRPPSRTRWKLWASLGLLLGAIAVGLGVHFYISISEMRFQRHQYEMELPLPLEGTVDGRPSESL